jgi:hypothetical protein
MRAFTILAITATLLTTLAASNAAVDTPGASTAKHTLDGWGQFKFGMTPDQAHAVPGVSWPRATNANAPTVVTMDSLPMTSEYGPDTHVSLAFNPDQKLREIRLFFKDTQSAADCEKNFLKTLASFDAKVGAFAAGGASEDWSVPGDSGQSLLERTSALKLPGSRSGYWRRSILPNISGLNLEAEAKRAFGSRWIELEMLQKDGKDGCYRSIAFTADMPSKAQLEMQFKLSHIPTGMDWHWAELDRSGRGFASGPAQPVFSTGPAEHVRLSGSRFAADVKRPPGGQGPATLHLVGTIANNKISAHVTASDAVPDDFPTNFEGSVSMFTTDGEPVDAYEISLTGATRRGSATLGMAAYHRNSPHTPTPESCRKITESASAARRTVREMTYKGLLQALGCPPP